MTAPHTPAPSTQGGPGTSPLLRTAIWVAIGALIAAAIVCVVWVLVGSQNGIVGRAFLTILLLAAFAGVSIMDVHLAPRRPTWFTLVSMGAWVVSLLIGAFLIWMPEDNTYSAFGRGFGRLFSFLLIVLVIELAVLHIRLYTRAIQHRRMPFTVAVTWVTVALVVLLAVMLVVALTLWEWVDFHDIYWRIVVAVTILATVGTALVPLVNALFAPRRARPAPAVAAVVAPPGWPTYADGWTPLPMLPDGSPDGNAYYTGQPSPYAVPVAPSPVSAPPAPSPVPVSAPAPAPQQVPQQVPPPPGYEGYPPPPPLPPQQ